MTLAGLKTALQDKPDFYSYDSLADSDRRSHIDVYAVAKRVSLYNLVWLHVTVQDVSAMNARLPKGVRVGAVGLVEGGLGLSVDLLTDCGAGCTYEAIALDLKALKFIYSQPAAG